MASLPFPKAHTYGTPRLDLHVNCNPFCSAVLGVRVPNTAKGKAKHDAMHDTYGTVAEPIPPPAFTPWLPFDMPADIRQRSRKVVAHYFTAHPPSLDNTDPDYWIRNYLNPKGEARVVNGVTVYPHATYGGLVRDVPPGRPPRSGDWRLEDAKDEIRQAISAGIDGFALNIMTLPGLHPWQPDVCRATMRAAQIDPDFRVILCLDATSNWASSHADIAAFLAELAAMGGPNTWRGADGKVALSAFGVEAKPVDWWRGLFAAMTAAGCPVGEFHPIFGDIKTNLATYAPIIAGAGEWGDRNPLWNDTSPTGIRRARMAAVHGLAKTAWFAVSVQDQRPREGLFDEAENTTNLRNTAQIAIEGAAASPLPSIYHGITFNDFAEHAHICRSKMHGDTYLRLTAYYGTWFKTGVKPQIVRDAIELTHRTQFASATPTGGQTLLMKLRGGSLPRDTAEALVFLKAPATVVVTSGGNSRSYRMEAGVHPLTCVLGLGFVSARIVRDGVTVLEVKSPHEVKAPVVQDLQYVAVGKVAA